MLLRGREGDIGEIKGTWHSGEVERGPCQGHSQRGQNRGHERRESPRVARPGHNDHLGLSKRDAAPQSSGQPECLTETAVPSQGGPWLKTDGVKSLERGLCPTCGLEGPAAQSFEHAHSACMVHLGTQALAGAAPPGPQSPLNGDLDLG